MLVAIHSRTDPVVARKKVDILGLSPCPISLFMD
jgi:hypothetical protein